MPGLEGSEEAKPEVFANEADEVKPAQGFTVGPVPVALQKIVHALRLRLPPWETTSKPHVALVRRIVENALELFKVDVGQRRSGKPKRHVVAPYGGSKAHDRHDRATEHEPERSPVRPHEVSPHEVPDAPAEPRKRFPHLIVLPPGFVGGRIIVQAHRSISSFPVHLDSWHKQNVARLAVPLDARANVARDLLVDHHLHQVLVNAALDNGRCEAR